MLTVSKQESNGTGRRWGIFNGTELVEGGFRTKAAAEAQRDEAVRDIERANRTAESLVVQKLFESRDLYDVFTDEGMSKLLMRAPLLTIAAVFTLRHEAVRRFASENVVTLHANYSGLGPVFALPFVVVVKSDK